MYRQINLKTVMTDGCTSQNITVLLLYARVGVWFISTPKQWAISATEYSQVCHVRSASVPQNKN